MEGATQPKTTNYELALMLGELKGDIKVIKQTTDKLEHSLNGNAKPGLIAEHQTLVIKVDKIETKLCGHIDDHVAEKKAATEKREKLSGRTWAVILAVVGAFITQTAALISLFIRTGTIH